MATIKRRSSSGETIGSFDRLSVREAQKKNAIDDKQKRGSMCPGVLRVAVPPGIGDALWSLTKIPSILKQRPDVKRVVVCVKDTDLNRSDDFLRHFSFVHDVVYEPFPIHPASGDLSPEGPYVYEDSRPGFLGAYDWLLISNGHLERGLRLEEWLPEFETDFTIGIKSWKWRANETNETAAIERGDLGSGPYVVFYLGPTNGNTVDGHNRGPLWSLDDWARTADLMVEREPGLRVLIVGAPYDKDYATRLVAEHPRPHWVNKCGQTRIGVTYGLCSRSRAVLSYQSGIGIFSVYLGVPSVVWWRPYGDSISPTRFLSFDEKMASAWAPPWSLSEGGNYLPMIYKKCSPESVVEEFVSRGWLGGSWPVKRSRFELACR